MMAETVVLYRGPFQGRRLDLLVSAVGEVHGACRLVWLRPGFDGPRVDFFDRWVEQRAYITDHEVLDGRLSRLPRIWARLRGHRVDTAYAVGFTALPYARLLRPERLVWCINGIPEERLLHSDSIGSRLWVRALWETARRGRTPDLVVTVSEHMGDHVRKRLGPVNFAVAPTAVDTDTFGPPRGGSPEMLTYVGSGAPWQRIDLLADVWRAIHERDPSQRFLVVSKDPRTKALGEGLPSEAVQFVSAATPDEVAAELARTKLGFLLRSDHIVNQVSYPTKFGEYLAAGVPVMTTDIDWDIGTIVEQTGCGALVAADGSPHEIADAVLGLVHNESRLARMRDATQEAAGVVSRAYWRPRLIDALSGVRSDALDQLPNEALDR